MTFNEHRESFMIKSLGRRRLPADERGREMAQTFLNWRFQCEIWTSCKRGECCEEIMLPLTNYFTRHTLCNQAQSRNVSFIFQRISKIDILYIYCKTQVPFYGSGFQFFFHFHFLGGHYHSYDVVLKWNK